MSDAQFTEAWRWWRELEADEEDNGPLHALMTVCRDGEAMIITAGDAELKVAACGFTPNGGPMECPQDPRPPEDAFCEACRDVVERKWISGEKPIVIVESPYAGDVEKNVAYARAAVADCLKRGEAPFASHLLYTQIGVLADEIKEQRLLGITAGFAFRRAAARTVVYIDRGFTPGMRLGIEQSRQMGVTVVERSLPVKIETDPKPVAKPFHRF